MSSPHCCYFNYFILKSMMHHWNYNHWSERVSNKIYLRAAPTETTTSAEFQLEKLLNYPFVPICNKFSIFAQNTLVFCIKSLKMCLYKQTLTNNLTNNLIVDQRPYLWLEVTNAEPYIIGVSFLTFQGATNQHKWVILEATNQEIQFLPPKSGTIYWAKY